MKIFKTVTLLLLLSWITPAFSQLAIGPKVGLSIAKWNTEMSPTFSEDHIESLIGFQGGIVLEYGWSDRLAIQGELYFLQKGTKIQIDDFNGQGATFDQSNSFTYLEVPVLLKLKLNASEEGIGFFGLIGPSFGYATSGKTITRLSANGSTEELEESFEFDNNPDFKRTELSLAFGAGVNIPAGTGQFFVDARYLLGLTDLDDGDPEIRNRGIGISLGYLLSLGQ